MKDKTKKLGSLGRWIFFILGVLIAVILSVPQFGTAEYVIGMLSRWWI